MILKQTRVSYRAVFCAIYQISDELSEFSLNAAQLGRELGYSRKTIYEAISFLKRVNLLHVVDSRTGRGHHSLYQLNWWKSEDENHSTRFQRNVSPRKRGASGFSRSRVEHGMANSDQSFEIRLNENSPANKIRPVVKNTTVVNSAQKCHPNILNRSIKENIHPPGDKMLKKKEINQQTSNQKLNPRSNPKTWRRAMKSLRVILQKTKLSKAHQRLAIGVLGRAIKNRKLSLFTELESGLNRGVTGLQAADWVVSDSDFCRWFRGVVNLTLANERLRKSAHTQTQSAPSKKPPHHRVADRQWRAMDVNERQWALVSWEKERISRQRLRSEASQSLQDDWQRWAEDQRAEERYRQVLADQARQRLRERRRRNQKNTNEQRERSARETM